MLYFIDYSIKKNALIVLVLCILQRSLVKDLILVNIYELIMSIFIGIV